MEKEKYLTIGNLLSRVCAEKQKQYVLEIYDNSKETTIEFNNKIDCQKFIKNNGYEDYWVCQCYVYETYILFIINRRF